MNIPEVNFLLQIQIPIFEYLSNFHFLVARFNRPPSDQIRVGIQEEKDFQVLDTVSTEGNLILKTRLDLK